MTETKQAWIERVSSEIEEAVTGKRYEEPSPFIMHYLFEVYRMGVEDGLSKIPPKFLELAEPKNIIEYKKIKEKVEREVKRLKALYDRDETQYRKEVEVNEGRKDQNGNFELEIF